MPSNRTVLPIPEGVRHVASEDADVVSWSNRRLRGGREALVLAVGVMLLWLSLALWITDLAFFGSLPGLLSGVLAIVTWSVLLFLFQRVLTLAGKESIRVGNDEITFTFAGVGRHRTIRVIRGELESLTLGDRGALRGFSHRGKRLFSRLAEQLSGRPTALLLLAEQMEHDEKAALHSLLCNIFAKRNWKITVQAGEVGTASCGEQTALPAGGN